ncbi:MAG: Flp pilus assembly protein CpaB [Emcibacter sp.]|nr:Flp pilus assembly protein CpaB [Emcibacter sp.]
MNINIKSVVLIGIALLVAGVTAMLARNLVSTPQPQAGGQKVIVKIVDSKMKVLITSVNIPVGHFIKAEDLAWQSWPDEKVHENYIQKSSKVKIESFVGAVATSLMSAGEPILNKRMVKPGNRGFMAAVLPKGMRAISVRINATSGNAGFVFPGDRVDILLTHEVAIKSRNRKTARISETVLRNVRVLAINQRTDNLAHKAKIGKTATLEVTPKDAQKISLIKNIGQLTLILRSLGTEKADTAVLAGTDKTMITWDSEVSRQLSGSTNKNKHYVKVFRGGIAKGNKTFNFKNTPKQSLNANEGDDSDDAEEE